ncbi:hypothetical protein CN173_34610 [Sinorhizobium meliloti]|nr:hypothetical protein CN173_34610 [Sinorhizobium meliloti]
MLQTTKEARWQLSVRSRSTARGAVTAVAVSPSGAPSKQMKKDLDACLWLAACLAGKSAPSGDR